MILPRAEPVADWTADELAAAEKLRAGCKRLLAECGKVIVGQEEVIEQLLIALLAKGHCLLVGVPGLAKTLMIRTLADGMNLTFNRIQFTPDLMPSDITGTEILQDDQTHRAAVFKFLHGPIFANVVLADEINRTPPKTQAALLEAMQEKQVTVGGHAAPAAGPVLRAGDAEPDRAGRHLPAARSAAGPLHVQRSASTTRPRRTSSASSRRRPPRRKPKRGARGRRRRNSWRCRSWCGRCRPPGIVIRYAMKLARLTRPGRRTASRRHPNVPDFVKKYVTGAPARGPGRT